MKKSDTKQTFLFGALILVCANIIVKIIGAIFRIPIYKILGSEGLANYQDAYAIYATFFAVSTAGLPVALQKMIAVSKENQNPEEENKIFKFALLIFVLVGVAGAVILTFGARAYSVYFVQNPEAYLGIAVLAPALFFVCVMSAYRGYFQGCGNMIPTSVSEIIGALGRAAVGIAAALFALARYGPERLDIVAAFAVGGITVGIAGGTLYLFIKKFRAAPPPSSPGQNKTVRTNGEITKEIIKISIPVMLSTSIASLSGIIDSFIMRRRLKFIGWDADAANDAYGDYFGMADPFFRLPNTLVVPLAVSIITVIAAAFAEKNRELIKSTVESTFRVTLLIAAPASFGLGVMAKPILNLIYPEKPLVVEAFAPMLTVLAFAIVFVCLMTVTNAVLNAQGQEKKPIISMALGMGVKIISSYILIGIPKINMFGTPVSTVLCYFTVMCANFYFMAKYTGVAPPLKRTVIKPLLAGAVMAVCAAGVYLPLDYFTGGSRIAALAGLFAAVVVYFVLVLVFKTLTKDDVLLLPKGEKIYGAMKKRKLID